MNKRIFVYVLALLFIYDPSYAQQFPDTYFESNSGKLAYGFYIPENYDSTQSYPLLMYLHGWGNNYAVYLDWYNSDIQTENPCFVYTPRTPVSWADWSGWSNQLTEPMTVALHVLDSMVTVYSIDTDRLYVYGISMGGEGVFDLLHKLPDKFAAAMSVCGGGRTSWAENIAKTPFWMFHGSADDINPPTLTEQVYYALVNLGAKKMRYKMYPGYGHEIWDIAASEPSWRDWMFSHSKDDTSCSKPTGRIELTGVIKDNKIQLSWNDIRNPDNRANKIWYYKIYNKDAMIGSEEYNKTTHDFTIINPVDTFRVCAVNYHFKESDKSNLLFYNNGSIFTRINNKVTVPQPFFKLYNNCPNPFNPITKISYSIYQPSHVSIVIYDLFGRVVTKLVNEEKVTGNYSIEFDISKLPESRQSLSSGIYYYQLKTNTFVKTKKMILLQ